jgi:hypothetical protein
LIVQKRPRKAEEILLSTEVISKTVFSNAGHPPEAIWALSVTMKYDPHPVERLKNIARSGRFEGMVMSLVAIKALVKRAEEQAKGETPSGS